jgi:transcription elongation factor Elf1
MPRKTILEPKKELTWQDLKPCAHCGSSNVGSVQVEEFHRVVCLNCGVNVGLRNHLTKESAYAAWNRRSGE